MGLRKGCINDNDNTWYNCAVHTGGINRLYSSNERKLMDKQLLLIILVGLVFAIWEYIKYKRQKELDERLQKHLWKYFNKKHW